MDDLELLPVQMLRHSPHHHKAKRLIPPHHGKGATGIHMANTFADLIERLFDIGRNGKHVAEIAWRPKNRNVILATLLELASFFIAR